MGNGSNPIRGLVFDRVTVAYSQGGSSGSGIGSGGSGSSSGSGSGGSSSGDSSRGVKVSYLACTGVWQGVAMGNGVAPPCFTVPLAAGSSGFTGLGLGSGLVLSSAHRRFFGSGYGGTNSGLLITWHIGLSALLGVLLVLGSKSHH